MKILHVLVHNSLRVCLFISTHSEVCPRRNEAKSYTNLILSSRPKDMHCLYTLSSMCWFVVRSCANAYEIIRRYWNDTHSHTNPYHFRSSFAVSSRNFPPMSIFINATTEHKKSEKCKTVEIQLIRSLMQYAHGKKEGDIARMEQKLAMYQFIATLYESHDNF